MNLFITISHLYLLNIISYEKKTLVLLLHHAVIAKFLADSAKRTLGAIIQYMSLSGFGYYIYTKMYHSDVAPIRITLLNCI